MTFLILSRVSEPAIDTHRGPVIAIRKRTDGGGYRIIGHGSVTDRFAALSTARTASLAYARMLIEEGHTDVAIVEEESE